MTIPQWSTTASSNASGVTNVNWAEGQAPSTVNDSARNMMADIATWLGQASGAIPEYLTSVAGTNTITATGPAQMASYVAGQRFTFIPANSVTGATTINITPSGASALGAKNVFMGGAALAGGEIQANVPVTILYDGTQFNVLGVVKAPTVQVFTSTGANTWTKPTGLRCVIVEVWGAGGGGGTATDAGLGADGGGGGAGGYSRKRIAAASLGSTETATVGAGGGSAAGGGTSSFGAHCQSTGGSAGSNAGDGVSGAGGSGGAGSSGDVNGNGESGSYGNRAHSLSGRGGSSPLGSGGGSVVMTSTGAAATGKAAGGSGGGNASGAGTQNGGAGTAGIIVVTEFY